MHITVAHKTIVAHASPGIQERLKEMFTIVNPAYSKAIRMNKRTYGIPKVLKLYEFENGNLLLPRGSAQEIIHFCKSGDPATTVEANLVECAPVPFTFTQTLKPFQSEAVEIMLKSRSGVLNAPTGSGKTVMALAMIARRQQTSLILVHTDDLRRQWAERIAFFLGIPEEQIGMICGGKKQWEGCPVTVGIINSVEKMLPALVPHFGHVLVDECHRTPGRTFIKVVSAFSPAWLTGLTATPYRSDGLTKLIFWYLGPERYAISRSELIASHDLLSADIYIRKTGFSTRLNTTLEYSKVIDELTKDELRNRQIAADVKAVYERKCGTILILSDRREHCETLAQLLNEYQVPCAVLHGKIKKEEREATAAKVDTGEIEVLAATGQLVGEGFDAKRLTVLFIVTPIRFNGRLQQYFGRVLRTDTNKTKALVFDYADVHVGPLANSARIRAKSYEAMGARIV